MKLATDRVFQVKVFVVVAVLIFAINVATSVYSMHSILPHANRQYERLRGTIPNQVHYAWLLESDSEFRFTFAQWLSIYSAWYYWKPHTFYIHTDASDIAICRAQGSCIADGDPTNKWTRLIFNMPNVQVNRVTAPLQAEISKVAISRIEHKADFIRVDAVNELGGVYLDWDAYAVRDITPLRKAGFAAVVGREPDSEDIQTGTWMCRAHSLMSTIWAEEQHVVFDGAWTTHSNRLLKSIGHSLIKYPGEILIMEKAAFTPAGYIPKWQESMLQVHRDHPSALDISINSRHDTQANLTFADDDLSSPPLGRLHHPENYPDWAVDFSQVYVMHHYDKFLDQMTIEGFDPTELTPRYILQRQSNIARLLYPAVLNAFQRGIIEVDDTYGD